MLTLKAMIHGILMVACLALFGVIAFVKFSRNRLHSAGVSYTEARHYIQRKDGDNTCGIPTILSC